MKTTINFSDIEKLFPSDEWDIGYLSERSLVRCGNTPIKEPTHSYGVDYSNQIHFHPVHKPIMNAVVLVRKTLAWDYTFYQEATDIMISSGLENWVPIYTNFKEAAILSGIGVRARNSLIYTYKFGFDGKLCAIGFTDEIVNVPLNARVNHKLWKRCDNCYDCIDNCPADAIHGKTEPFWIDAEACDNFIGLSDHPTIPSIKKFWYAKVYPEFPKDEVSTLKTMADVIDRFNGPLPFDKNGYTFDGFVIRKDEKTQQVPICRECISQPRCSKWEGKFPYKQYEEQQ